MTRRLFIGIDATQLPLRISSFDAETASDPQHIQWRDDQQSAGIEGDDPEPFSCGVPVRPAEEFPEIRNLALNSLRKQDLLPPGWIRAYLNKLPGRTVAGMAIAHSALLAPEGIRQLVKSVRNQRAEVSPVAAPFAAGIYALASRNTNESDSETVVSCTCGLALPSLANQKSCAWEWLQVTRTPNRESGGFNFQPDWFCSDAGDLYPSSVSDSERLTRHLALLPPSSRVLCSSETSFAAYEGRRRLAGDGVTSQILQSAGVESRAVARGAALFAERAARANTDWQLTRRIPIIVGVLGEVQRNNKTQVAWRELIESPQWALEVNSSSVDLATLHGFSSSQSSAPRWRLLQEDESDLLCYDTLLDENFRGISTKQHAVAFEADSFAPRDWSVRVPVVRPSDTNSPPAPRATAAR